MAQTRTVLAACPHDCPDTCSMLVSVDDEARAVQVAGNPDQPVTAGFLCGKVSNYLDRVYASDRLLHPLVREGPKGSGEFRRASWDEALDLAASGLRGAIESHGPESILPYSYMGTMGLLQADLMGDRVMNALGTTEIERTICATAGITGVAATHGISPEVDPELWAQARYLLLWGWNPMSTAPHLWRLLLEARRAGARLVVIDPFRSRTARVADEHLAPLPGTDGALALGMMRAVADAGLQDEEWCRAHTSGYDELLERLESWPVSRAAEICGVGEEAIMRIGREFASASPALLRLGVGAQRHRGAPMAYRTIACLPGLTGAWRDEGGGCSYIPTATAAAVSSEALKRADLRAGPARRINMSQLGDALCDRNLDPPVTAFVCWGSNPAQIAPEQNKVLAGLRRDDLFTVVLEQFMTDTARLADVVLPATTALEHLDAVASWGHQYVTFNEPAIAPVGEAKPNTEIFRLLAARLGLDDPCFRESDEELMASLLAGAPGGVGLDELRSRGFVKVDLGQGAAPHAEGGFGTADGRLSFDTEWLAEAGMDSVPEYEPPAEAVGKGGGFGLAMITPKTHLFLNSTFANQDRQHRSQPEPFVVVNPEDALSRGLGEGDRARVFNDRGSFVSPVRISDEARPGVLVAPTGWWSEDYEGGAGPQATTSQELTALGNAPIFNDNRVEIEPA
ncbi:MAG: molybdopterin-dependent oxidoreductase [Thermoleophilaceae bacterium]